jgi:hypothetical protein
MKRIDFSSSFVAISILLFLFSWGCGGGGGSPPAGSADSNPLAPAADSLVAEWNETAMSLTPTLGTHMGIRALTMMHVAMHDAVTAFDNEYNPYHMVYPPPEGASKRAAAASAAEHVLRTVFTSAEHRAIIQARYSSHLAQIEEGIGKNDGVSFGQTIAKAIMDLRFSDGTADPIEIPDPPPPMPHSFSTFQMEEPYPDGTEPGEWRRTGSGEPMMPKWGEVTPWAMMSGDQFDQGGPPLLTDQEYLTDYNEVKMLGGKNSTIRTDEESFLADFWAPHVPAKWNSLARDISNREQLPLVESARLFALLSVTLADSAISGWNMKYKYNFWRPVTAINLGDDDTNDFTEGDAEWDSYIPAPAFPEYVSGHSLTCAASATVLARYLGTDDYTFELRTMGIPNSRTFNSLWQAAEEAGESRICGGIHFRFSHEDGLAAGQALGNYVFDNFFKPN